MISQICVIIKSLLQRSFFLTDKPEETSITFFPDRAVLGEQVVITCNADGQPKPRYVLFHNDTAITGVRYEKKFTISPLMWNHTGTYNCTAINSLGRNSTSRFLNVISEGKIYIVFAKKIVWSKYRSRDL